MNGSDYRVDAAWYSEEYPDVVASGLEAQTHYEMIGRKEHRFPRFDPEWYLFIYPDVAENNLDPLYHYRTWGREEKRIPAFPHDWYLERHPDVARAGIDPYQHFRDYGRAEGRSFNPLLKPDHENINVQTPPYDSSYECARSFEGRTTDIKAIAFHLPQFHEVKENNEWWGEGFTEWTNVRQAVPRFWEHYQPRTPHADIGYYDLSKPEHLAAQADMAKKFGIYGFCFYHYWFSGRRILEKPVDTIISDPNINIKFCLCWANENWTRTWDGAEENILLEQRYSKEDQIRFIEDIESYLLDPRYISVDERPILMIYKPNIIPDFAQMVNVWRQYWRDKYKNDLYICINRTNYEDTGCTQFEAVVDAVVEFPPHVVPYKFDQQLIKAETDGNFFNYPQLVDDIVNGNEKAKLPNIDFYRTVMLGWDNSARRKSGWSCWYGYSIKKYDKWLRHIVKRTRDTFPENKRFVFINAWNEWAEGTYLEPDDKYGYMALNTTARALYDLLPSSSPEVLPSLPQQAKQALARQLPVQRVALHVHIYFEDAAHDIAEGILNIGRPFDLFITTDNTAKAKKFVERVRSFGLVEKLSVIETRNMGRDIGPFLVEVAPRLMDYDIVGHIHTKKSETVDWGGNWRRHILRNLLGSTDGVRSIFELLSKEDGYGILYPAAFPLIADFVDWGGLRERVQLIARELFHIDVGLASQKPEFPVGNMFWARIDAIRPILSYRWSWSDFEEEHGQVGGTLAHCIERMWGIIAETRGFPARPILLADTGLDLPSPKRRRLAIFVHYSQSMEIAASDLHYLHHLRTIASHVVFVSNSPLSKNAYKQVVMSSDRIIQRDNVTADFGAWAQALAEMGREYVCGFDELILANNSCFFPIFPVNEMLSVMSRRYLDFWGVSGFPKIENSTREEACLLNNGDIPHHIQSYFMVFRNNVMKHDAFWDFWSNLKPTSNLIEVVAYYEAQLTGVLTSVGFKHGFYLPELEEIQSRNAQQNDFNAVYSRPIDGFLLRSPFVKKKIALYAPKDIAALLSLIRKQGHYPMHLLSDWY